MANLTDNITEENNKNQNTQKQNKQKELTLKYEFSLDSTLPYYLILIPYSLFYLGVYLHNQFFVIVFVFVVLPYTDTYLSLDLINPSKEKQRELKKNNWFRAPLYFASACEMITYFYGVYHMTDPNYGYYYKASCLFVLMTFQGVSINYSHELNHKVNTLDNILGAILLIKNFYLHWFIEHNYGHHKTVGTPLDPASAVKGMTVWQFIPQSFFGAMISSWRIEQSIVKEEGRSVFTNRIYISIVIYVITASCLLKFLGVVHGLIAIFIGVFGPLYLEVVNYLEHYGLRRKMLENGEYEVVSIHHSWNTPHRATNYMLFKLQRHSDHHANALKPYQTLCSYDESPNLPQGYAFCIVLAISPSNWFDIIDPLVDVYTENQKIPQDLWEKTLVKCETFLHKSSFFICGLMMLQFALNLL